MKRIATTLMMLVMVMLVMGSTLALTALGNGEDHHHEKKCSTGYEQIYGHGEKKCRLTTTSTIATSTTTTTLPSETTSTTQPSSSTSTTDVSPTTQTLLSTTTSTTRPALTTTAPTPPTTNLCESEGEVPDLCLVPSTPATTPDVLPFTGIGSLIAWGMAGLGVLGSGILTVRKGRREE